MILGLLFIIIGLAVVSYQGVAFKQELDEGIERLYKNAINGSKEHEIILVLQKDFHCCGARNVSDFPLQLDFDRSCCKNQTTECQRPSPQSSIISHDEIYFPVSYYGYYNKWR